MKDLLDPVHAAVHDGQPGGLGIQGLDGAEQVKDEEHDAHQVGDAHESGALQRQGDGRDGRRPQAVGQVQPQLPGGVVLLKLEIGVAAPLEVVRQLPGLFSQQIVGLDDPDAFHEVQHRLGEILVLLLPRHGVLEGLTLHAPGNEQHDADDRKGCQADPEVKAEQEDHQDGLGKNVAHHVRQYGHAVFLNEHHVGGKDGADFANVALGEVAHGHPPQVGAQLHPHVRKYQETRRGLEPVGDVVKEDLKQDADHQGDAVPEAVAGGDGPLVKAGEHQERQHDRRLGQQGFQE